jgi:hypothetical protein
MVMPLSLGDEGFATQIEFAPGERYGAEVAVSFRRGPVVVLLSGIDSYAAGALDPVEQLATLLDSRLATALP